ncbi:deoxyribonuclease II [Tachypleus tridentatus]|uniref:deoxyribonuclease II n=1 Tax=Tachypleus tridentatus TaxID=6853 RepID=UPI003FD62B8C
MLTIFLLTCLSTSNALNCKDDTGEYVDWIFIIKFPEFKGIKKSGEKYAYVSNKNKGAQVPLWEFSNLSIKSSSSVVGQLVSEINYKQQYISYIYYNDQIPAYGTKYSYGGHQKGVVAFDNTSGVWLIHSVPDFPPAPKDKRYIYPDSGLLYGQTMLCVTVNSSMANTIGLQLRYSKPHIYGFRLSQNLRNIAPEMVRLVESKYINKPPWTSQKTIRSHKGTEFIHFNKHDKFDKDLYMDLVAPGLNTSLYVETWRKGRGENLNSECAREFSVWNVEEVSCTNKTSQSSIAYTFEKDHSKWAISSARIGSWVCVGDINRMKSQFRRGGGTLCLKDKFVFQTFSSFVSNYEKCQLHQQHELK